MNKTNIFYVYQLRDPRKQYPFYIGKGKNKRAWDHLKDKDKTHKTNTIRQIQFEGINVQIEILYKELPENIAYAIEKILIKRYGRRDNNTGCLTNQTNGGEGISSGDARKLALKQWSTEEQILKDKILKSRPSYRKIMSDNMKNNFSDDSYRKRHIDVMNREDVKSKLSKSVKNAWNKATAERLEKHSKQSSKQNSLWRNGRVSERNLLIWADSIKIKTMIESGETRPSMIAKNLGYIESSAKDVCANIRNHIIKGWNPSTDHDWLSRFLPQSNVAP